MASYWKLACDNAVRQSSCQPRHVQ